MRNPVIAIPHMVMSSDIPDWGFVEAGVSPQPLYSLTSQLMETLAACSPLQYAGAVTTPTLMLLGDKDLRVPPEQGRLWYDALRDCGKAKTKLLRYPEDSHALSGVGCAADCFMSAWQWLEEQSLNHKLLD